MTQSCGFRSLKMWLSKSITSFCVGELVFDVRGKCTPTIRARQNLNCTHTAVTRDHAEESLSVQVSRVFRITSLCKRGDSRIATPALRSVPVLSTLEGNHPGSSVSPAWLKSALAKGDFASDVTLKSDHDEVACQLDRAYVGHA